jgi:deoxyadenosine/deoxycytidine kinase
VNFEQLKRILKETRKFDIKKPSKMSNYYTIHSKKLQNMTQEEVQFLHEEIATQTIDVIETIQEISQTLKDIATNIQTIKDGLKVKEINT